MSRDWTNEELKIVSEHMKLAGHMSYEEFCEEMNKMIKGILITKNSAEVISAEDALNVWYTLLNCSCIDIITRKIGDKYYDIVCDDEALLKSEPVPRAVCRNSREILFGNLFICGHANDEGNLTSLSDEDVKQIKRHIALHSDLGPILKYNI